LNVNLRIFHFIPETQVEGPGRRACIQVQGCPIHCKGCAVPQTWAPHGGKLIDADWLIEQILDIPTIEGVTFLGGEPFAQADALAHIGKHLQRHGKSVVTFSGYRLETLQNAQRDDYHALLTVTDLLIDGPFDQQQVDYTRPWVGSRNQRFHFLTERYAHLRNQLDTIPNRIEVRLSPDGSIRINGLAAPEDMTALIQHIL
jgi:anaerobic ribonucleoside-triphosphate reductase activating protein